MRKLSLLLFLFLLPMTARAATTPTAVSGSIQDPNGIPYAGGTVSVQLVPTGTNPTVDGASIQGTLLGHLDSTGSFTIALYPNASILCNNVACGVATQWQFTVCSNPGGIQPPLGTGTQCTPPTAITIAGASQSVSATLNAVAPSLTNFAGLGGTVTHTAGALTAGLPVIGNGAGDIKVGTKTGITTLFPTFSGAATPSRCVDTDASGNLVVTAADCAPPPAGILGSAQFNEPLGTLAGTLASLKCNSGMAGADWGAKANTCMAALPAGGGFADMSELNGAQTLGTAVTIPAGVTLYCGADTQLSQTAAVTLSNTNSAFVGSPDWSCVITKAANLDQVTVGAAQTLVQFLTLAGNGGTNTGNGIVESNANAIVQYNVVNGEAGAGIANTGGGIIRNNSVSSSTTGHPITAGNNSSIIFNTVSSTHSDAIYSTGNSVRVENNQVSLNPAASTSGLCGINMNGDQIGGRVLFNMVQISDTSNSSNVDNGVCDTPTGTHNLDMEFTGNHVTGITSGTVTTNGFLMNNAANLNTNWSVTVLDQSCVHIGPPTSTAGGCISRTDTQNNVSAYQDVQQGDGALDAGTGSTNDIWVLHDQNLAFASLPSPAGSGSSVFCSNCLLGSGPASVGVGGNLLTRIGSTWYGTLRPGVAAVQSAINSAAASSAATAFTSHSVPGNFLIAGIGCYNGSSTPPTLAVSDTQGNVWTSAKAVAGASSATGWVQIFYSAGTLGGADTITGSSSGTVCTTTFTIIVEFTRVLQTSPEDGAGASASGTSAALASGNYTVSLGDLNVGMATAGAGGLCVGAGAGWTPAACSSGIAMLEYQVATSTTANAQAAANNGGSWAIVGVAFKPAP